MLSGLNAPALRKTELAGGPKEDAEVGRAFTRCRIEARKKSQARLSAPSLAE
jgi:hypothetical protein